MQDLIGFKTQNKIMTSVAKGHVRIPNSNSTHMLVLHVSHQQLHADQAMGFKARYFNPCPEHCDIQRELGGMLQVVR